MPRSLVSERSALDFFPAKISYSSLAAAARTCKGCDIYMNATQTVFGEGDRRDGVMFVGEQPGDEEDIKGHPFVGPAGRLLDKALIDAGIDRSKTYMTNAVKHFKWTPRGKRRLHERPKSGEIAACRPWLEAELEVIRPHVLVFLGATAAQSMLGAGFRVTQMRGKWLECKLADRVIATVHPSSILRAPDARAREEQYRAFVADLAKVAAVVQGGVRLA
ncbi:MAG: UdgX family uracil-DNA binding protein [Acidobacteria bacterium]|nr:UdgX family uracil-DNA binding protein [Acidobacteriota bacterium]